MTHVPLLIRAHLAAGVAHAHPWGIALDGLLASAIWATLKPAPGTATAVRDLPDVIDLDLPLARCTPPNGAWHWAATCSWPEQPLERDETHYWTQHLDTRPLEACTPYLPKTISEARGRYRTHHMPLPITASPTVTWHAVGDPEAVTELLTPLRAIGKKRRAGEGEVLAWEIHEVDLDPHAAAHLHPDGTLGRPTPAECLAGTELADLELGTAGLRPPYHHPSRRHTLVLPSA